MKFLLNFALISCLLVMGCDTTKKAVTSTPSPISTSTPAPTMPKPAKNTPPGEITWEAANERYSARGMFKNWYFTSLNIKGGNLETLQAKAVIDLASIWEKSPKLTDHLKAPDYFDTAAFTSANLTIVKVMKKGDSYVAKMNLAMRNQSQELDGTFQVTSEKPLRIKGSAMVDRSIFGIGVENTSVPNLIKVSFDTELKK